MATTLPPELLGPAEPLARDAIAELRADRSRLPVVFPGLPRKAGREPVGGGCQAIGDARVDLDAFRRCDLVAAWLLQEIAVTHDEAVDLFLHGDIEERAMLLRAANFLPLGDTTARLLGEVLRTNVVLHMEAALCDGDLLARAAAHGTIDAETANRLLLKFAFLDLPLERALAAERLASVELSTMLQDLATEREAAGRAVWRDTWQMVGRAPCPGAIARLIGGLEHGDDGVRLSAAKGLLALPDRTAGLAAEVARYAGERLPREPRPVIRELLQRLAQPA
ncbi:MAG TPA: hypothetical protein ENI87_14560 [bacterium]|nr:hypothetical protein [bacterium]